MNKQAPHIFNPEPIVGAAMFIAMCSLALLIGFGVIPL